MTNLIKNPNANSHRHSEEAIKKRSIKMNRHSDEALAEEESGNYEIPVFI